MPIWAVVHSNHRGCCVSGGPLRRKQKEGGCSSVTQVPRDGEMFIWVTERASVEDESLPSERSDEARFPVPLKTPGSSQERRCLNPAFSSFQEQPRGAAEASELNKDASFLLLDMKYEISQVFVLVLVY